MSQPTFSPHMPRRRRYLWIVVLVILGLGALVAWQFWPRPQTVAATLVSGSVAPSGFTRASAGTPILLPADQGAHPDYQTEWWYFTGNLASDADPSQRWGYQFTIFRRALTPDQDKRLSGWSSNQVYLAHLAITDAGRNTHVATERFSRGGAGLAGAQSQPFRVWLEDAEVSEEAPGRWRLHSSHDGYTLDLTLEPAKPAVLQGKDGYSQKGSDPGNASHYYSYTRLQTSGTLTREGQTHPVSGLSWMDHEWSTSALEAGQVGWDWFSVQLDDGWDLMVFQLRRADGSVDRFTSGTLVDPDGKAIPLSANDLIIRNEGTWRSSDKIAVYPASWQIEAPEHDLSISLTPLIADQEMRLSTRYWEGAANVTGSHNGRAVQGRGYVEMTGYAGSMEGRF